MGVPSQRSDREEWFMECLQNDRFDKNVAILKRNKFCQGDFSDAVEVLCELANEQEWPIAAWKNALQVWQSKELCQKLFLNTHKALVKAPDYVVQSLDYEIGLWLRYVAETPENQQSEFFSLCRRMLNLTYEEMQDDDCVNRALNHPVGHITQALLNWCIHHQPSKDRQELADEARSIFTELCDARKHSSYCYGRILLATYAVFLHRCDAGWTRKHLLPFFDWRKSKEEAKAMWAGFLWSQVKYHPLLSDLKREFLETATHHAELDGDYTDQADNATHYVYFFTSVALDPGKVFTEEELAEAAYKLPPHLLGKMAYILYRVLNGADDRDKVWKNHVRPLLKKIWPHSIKGRKKPDVSLRLAKVCIEAENNFPDALDVVEGWLQPIKYTHNILPDIRDKKICQNFPDESLSFLDAIIDNNTFLQIPKRLKRCLDAIKESKEELADDPCFKRLEEYVG